MSYNSLVALPLLDSRSSRAWQSEGRIVMSTAFAPEIETDLSIPNKTNNRLIEKGRNDLASPIESKRVERFLRLVTFAIQKHAVQAFFRA